MSKANVHIIGAAQDGRRQRSARSREAIIKASLALIDQGVLVPTAQQIAEQAGVGVRSFFRHFEDMEALFEAVDMHAREQFYAPFERQPVSGTLAERVDGFLKNQLNAYGQLQNIILSAQAQAWRSKVLRHNYARDQRRLRDVLLRWFPELQDKPMAKCEAADAATSFDMWYRLRHHQQLGARESQAIMRDFLLNVLTD